MSLTLDVGPKNMLPSDFNGVPIMPVSLAWFDGSLTVNMLGEGFQGAVQIDFGLDEYMLYTVTTDANQYAAGYVGFGYVN